jgi:hypothetical protein
MRLPQTLAPERITNGQREKYKGKKNHPDVSHFFSPVSGVQHFNPSHLNSFRECYAVMAITR